MTENDSGPPDEKNGGAPTPENAGHHHHQHRQSSRPLRYEHANVPEDLWRRREAAVRLVGANPDPLFPGRRYHRPAAGHRASGYREGYSAALEYVLHEFGSQLDDLSHAKIGAIIKRSDS